MQKIEIAEALAIVTLEHPSFEVSKERVKLWYWAFKDTDKKDFTAAVMRYLKTNHFPPKIADINGILTTPDYPDSLTAWSEVRNKVRSVGYYGTPEFSHAAIAAAVQAFGWQNLCDMENPDVTRGQFVRMYQSYCQRGTTVAMLGPVNQKEMLEAGPNSLVSGIVRDFEGVEA
jgi:hypothetical protein